MTHVSLTDLEDYSDLIEEEDEGGEELSPREIKKSEFEETKQLLKKLAPFVEQMEETERAEYAAMLDDAERIACELSLAVFFRCAWTHMDTAPYTHNWHFDIISDEVEALVDGRQRRLMVNMPPRCGKSLLLTVALMAWIWIQPDKGPLRGPQVKFITASYAQSLSYEHSNLARKLMRSPWFAKHWGNRFKFLEDRDAIGYYENDKGGYRLSTSVGTGVTGRGADIIIIDDPSDTAAIASEAERQTVINWYRQSLSNRFNNPKTGAMVLVMQRQAVDDLSGYFLDNEYELWRSVVFRMRYESNPYLPYDPRTEEGELLWPERVPVEEVDKQEKITGSFGFAGLYQQRPAPQGGGLIKAEHWKIFPPEGEEETWKRDGVLCWPPLEFVVASVDLAYTEKQENDYSALTMWGLWYDKTGAPRIIVIHAWQARLSFNPLVMRIGNNCRKFKPDVLLIESKAAGISAAQEIRRVFGSGEWSTVLVNPKGDKVNRVVSVQGLFEEGLISAPDRQWAQELIDQVSVFPKGKHDDLVDTMSQALIWMRENGIISRRREHEQRVLDSIPRSGHLEDEAPPYDV